MIPVFSLGVDSVWLGMDSRDEMSDEALAHTTDHGVLVAMPIRLLKGEKLAVDYDGKEFFLSGIDLRKLIPSEIRTAFERQ